MPSLPPVWRCSGSEATCGDRMRCHVFDAWKLGFDVSRCFLCTLLNVLVLVGGGGCFMWLITGRLRCFGFVGFTACGVCPYACTLGAVQPRASWTFTYVYYQMCCRGWDGGIAAESRIGLKYLQFSGFVESGSYIKIGGCWLGYYYYGAKEGRSCWLVVSLWLLVFQAIK